MGLFDFFKKDSGKELFKENDAAEAKAEAIRAEIKRLGLQGDIKVAVDGDKVKISGKVPDQATKEKLMLIAGNTRHIQQVDDVVESERGTSGQAASPQARSQAEPVQQQNSKFHTVEVGDTLSEIAAKYYGDKMKYDIIFEANRPMLSDPDEIYPGQVLRIPSLGQQAA